MVQAALDRPPEISVASVALRECQNGYARVFATAAESNQQVEQVFLRDVGGVWVVVDFGSGIECSDPSSLNDADRTACAALGLTP